MMDYIECAVCDESITSQEDYEATDRGNVHSMCLDDPVNFYPNEHLREGKIKGDVNE